MQQGLFESKASSEACCEPRSLEMGACPMCGRRGKPVPRFTVSVMLRDPVVYMHPERLPDGKYFICEAKSCPTVYFGVANGITFSKDQLRVRVWQKGDDPDVPVCYCFHHTLSSIGEEIARAGGTDVLSRIGAEVKAGNCRCEVTNPQGSCCLGNVAKAVKIAKDRFAKTG